MIETQFGSERNDLIGPPCDADGMLRVFRRVTGATANDVVENSFRTVKNADGAILNIV